MSFTQKKKTNILHCDGCKKHCHLGFTLGKGEYYYPYLGFTLGKEEYYYPMIGGAVITSFQDENDNTQTTLKSKTWLSNKGIDHPFDQRVYMLDMARKIARLCDNYKQR